MKNWLSIGQFATRAGLSSRTLRVYEEVGLISSHTRGENGYRYYQEKQLELATRIKGFKLLGFSLDEIKALLNADKAMDSKRLSDFLRKRLEVILEQEKNLASQKNQIDIILSSLEQKNMGLRPNERRYIMSHFQKISIVVTGVKDLELTAQHVRDHLTKAGQKADVLTWNEKFEPPKEKPYILVVPEDSLRSEKVKSVMPDVVVIKNLSKFNSEIERSYLNLYNAVGPHMTTVFNADDRISVELAANEEIRKGRTFYFSKNSGLEDQIRKIGGVVSDGEDIKIFGFNLTKDAMSLKLTSMLGFDEEIALLASLAAVMDIGLDKTEFQSSVFSS